MTPKQPHGKVFTQHEWWLPPSYLGGRSLPLTVSSLYTLAPEAVCNRADLHTGDRKEQLASGMRVNDSPHPLLLEGDINSQHTWL